MNLAPKIDGETTAEEAKTFGDSQMANGAEKFQKVMNRFVGKV